MSNRLLLLGAGRTRATGGGGGGTPPAGDHVLSPDGSTLVSPAGDPVAPATP